MTIKQKIKELGYFKDKNLLNTYHRYDFNCDLVIELYEDIELILVYVYPLNRVEQINDIFNINSALITVINDKENILKEFTNYE